MPAQELCEVVETIQSSCRSPDGLQCVGHAAIALFVRTTFHRPESVVTAMRRGQPLWSVSLNAAHFCATSPRPSKEPEFPTPSVQSYRYASWSRCHARAACVIASGAGCHSEVRQAGLRGQAGLTYRLCPSGPVIPEPSAHAADGARPVDERPNGSDRAGQDISVLTESEAGARRIERTLP